jgi:hypothetical protein
VFTKQIPIIAALLLALPAVAFSQSTVTLNQLTGIRGLKAQGILGLTQSPTGPMPGDLGRASAMVDLNGDGFDDMVVGAPLLPTSPGTGVQDDAGHCFVLFGSATDGLPGSSADFKFSAFTQGQAIDFVGDPGDKAGSAVAAVGDVDGDGFVDVLIGTPGRTIGARTSAGGAYIVLGRADFATQPKVVLLSSLASSAANRAAYIEGANAFGATGSSVGGGVDCNNDGFKDMLLGSPLDSTDGLQQNGSATVLYGRPNLGPLNVLDLLSQGAGQVTVVRGTSNFQFMGFSVAGIGKFDPVLPMTNNLFNLFAGDDVAIGAPGTTVDTAFFAGAIYVLRGVASGVPATSYTAAQFGNGPNKAGIVYTGSAAGDQLGFQVAPAGDVIKLDTEGFTDFLCTAPFNDGLGKPDCGAVYVISGRIVGQNPQGFSVSLLGQGLQNVFGIYIQGAVTSGGQQGVWATNAGDWSGDGVPDILVGFPNVASVINGQVYASAGRARILDGSKLLSALGTVDLGNAAAGWDLIQLQGEVTAAYAGSGLSTGDFNGDGNKDIVVGAFGAPSDPSPFDLTGLAHLKTGRVHVIYGPVLRVTGIAPTTSWYGGPAVTVSAIGVPPNGNAVKVDGVSAAVTGVVPGDSGSITFVPGKPAVKGALADVSLDTPAGDTTLKDVLQLQPLVIKTGPSPTAGFPGSTVSFTGTGFSNVGDTTVTVGGSVATVTAVDGLLGTMTVGLPSGPPANTPLDVITTNANGSVTQTGVLQYLPLVVQNLSPNSGLQYSGVFSAGATPYPGEPPTVVQITVVSTVGAVPPNPLVEFGTAALGFRTAKVTGVAGSVITCEVPPFLIGPQTPVDVRVTFNSATGIETGGFTYLKSDFHELDQYAQAGFGTLPPRAFMAGHFVNAGQVLLQLDQLAPQMQLSVVVIGLGLKNPPPTVHGGPFPIDVGLPYFLVFFPFPGQSKIAISQAMPTNIDAGSIGVSLYLHVLCKEKSGPTTKYGFSNVLQMTIGAP